MRSRLRFCNASVKSIGRSVLGFLILGIFFDFGSKKTIIIHAAIHAREHITTNLALLLAKQLDANFSHFSGRLPNIIIIPQVNPDGVGIATNIIPQDFLQKTSFFSAVDEALPLEMFKANARGVDLNNNFNANFNTDPSYKSRPCSHGFAGYFFESEPESRALAQLARKSNTIFTVSLHCKGEEVYFNFNLLRKQMQRHKKVALTLSKMLKYKLVNTKTASCGGFKDYCVLKLKIPSVTIEVGSDSLTHPLNECALQPIAVRFRNFWNALTKAYKKIIKIGLSKF